MLQWLIENWKLVAFIVTGIFGWIIWAMSKAFAKKDDLVDLSDRVKELENGMKNFPDVDEFHELDKRLVEVGTKLDAVSPQLESVKRITDLLMENELRGKP